MKNSFSGFVIATFAAFAGCNQATPEGPGTTDVTAENPGYGQAEDTFSLSVPRLSTTLKQGETKTVALGINRDEKFNQDVTITFGNMPTGVTMEPTAPVITQGEAESQITLTAAEDAAPGDFTIKVTGHPATGADALSEFKFTVVEK